MREPRRNREVDLRLISTRSLGNYEEMQYLPQDRLTRHVLGLLWQKSSKSFLIPRSSGHVFAPT